MREYGAAPVPKYTDQNAKICRPLHPKRQRQQGASFLVGSHKVSYAKFLGPLRQVVVPLQPGSRNTSMRNSPRSLRCPASLPAIGNPASRAGFRVFGRRLSLLIAG